MAVERRSRQARLRSEWVSPLSSERAGDKGCPLDAEEGNVLSACATKATQPFERQLSLLTRSVTRPSLGPGARARQSSLLRRRKPSKVARSAKVRGWANRATGGTSTDTPSHGRSAARRAFRLSQEGLRECVRKGRRLRPPSLRGSRESRSECPHVVCSCRSRQRRHRVSNTLTCSTLQKGTRRE
jgi:hypothetical protein